MVREASLSLDHSPADSAGSGSRSDDTLAAQLSVADQGGQKVHSACSFGGIFAIQPLGARKSAGKRENIIVTISAVDRISGRKVY